MILRMGDEVVWYGGDGKVSLYVCGTCGHGAGRSWDGMGWVCNVDSECDGIVGYSPR